MNAFKKTNVAVLGVMEGPFEPRKTGPILYDMVVKFFDEHDPGKGGTTVPPAAGPHMRMHVCTNPTLTGYLSMRCECRSAGVEEPRNHGNVWTHPRGCSRDRKLVVNAHVMCAAGKKFQVYDSALQRYVDHVPILAGSTADTPMQHNEAECMGHSGKRACSLCSFMGDTDDKIGVKWHGYATKRPTQVPRIKEGDPVDTKTPRREFGEHEPCHAWETRLQWCRSRSSHFSVVVHMT